LAGDHGNAGGEAAKGIAQQAGIERGISVGHPPSPIANPPAVTVADATGGAIVA
jgi:hypothetical protein